MRRKARPVPRMPTNRRGAARNARRSIRLQQYDYGQAGAYFVTICAHQRQCLFGKATQGRVRLNRTGEIVRQEWLRLSEVRPDLALGAWVIMPSHIHGIIVIRTGTGEAPPLGLHWPADAVPRLRRPGNTFMRRATHGVAPTERPTGPKAASLGAIIGQLKSASTRRINALRDTPGARVWQRNYYEHVIRDEADLAEVESYIADNPRRWAEDRENPAMSPAARALRRRDSVPMRNCPWM